MIPEPEAIEACARALNRVQQEHGWESPPAIYTIYAMELAAGPLGPVFKHGLLGAQSWPIPPSLLAVDPPAVVVSLGLEIRTGVGAAGPIAYARQCAGPAFAGIAMMCEAWAEMEEGGEVRECRNVFIADCAGGFTFLADWRDGDLDCVRFGPGAESMPGANGLRPIVEGLRDMVLGVLAYCAPGTGDEAAVRLIGVPV